MEGEIMSASYGLVKFKKTGNVYYCCYEGTSDIMIPMNFLGDISHYIEMPKPEDIYDWEKYTNPNYLIREKL